jgi:tight adherence protein C
VASRKKQILRALPNALDMLSIGVESGLGFEACMLKVGEQWQNELTREFQRAVLEIRVGATRNDALEHLAARTDVMELNTFIAVLVQSSQLGVSITDVLHQQAAQMREKRRQLAEIMARQATIKMLFPLAFFIFPAMFIVLLGPSIPRILGMLGGL